MSIAVVINGQLIPNQAAKISVFDRGFLYGDSVFETLGTYRGQPFALAEHLARLRQSCTLVHIELDVDDRALAQEVDLALHAAGNEESYIRIIITRGLGELQLDPGDAMVPERVIIVAPLKRPPAEAYATGIRAIGYRLRRAADATEAGGAKVGNYLVAVLAMREARKADAGEALVIDSEGLVIEGATSNVFYVREGGLATPPEAQGILAGITRATILELAAGEKIPVKMEAWPLDYVKDADEVFVTSTIRELLSVVEIDGQRIGNGRPGPVYTRLLAAYRTYVAAACASRE